MKILLVFTEYSPETGSGYGIGSYVSTIAPALVDRGHEVHVLSCAWTRKASDDFDRGVFVHRRGFPRMRGFGQMSRHYPWFASRLSAGIVALIETRRLRTQFDIVEYPEWNAEGWALSLLRSIPTIAHVHMPLALFATFAGIPSTRDLRIASRLERMSVRRADAVTVPSTLLADTLVAKRWIERSNMTVIPQAVDWKHWQGTPPAGDAPPTVQFCGRIEAGKAPETLVDAVNMLCDLVPEASARFAGAFQPETSTDLPAMPWTARRSLQRCRFLGHVPRPLLKDVLASSRVLAHPSLFESFGMAVPEAMAAGRPVVVTSTTGLADMVRRASGGSVVPSKDPKALAEALRPFLVDPRYATEVGERARAFVRAELDPHRIAALREKAYESAIASHRGGVHTRTIRPTNGRVALSNN